jgi:hypothetical protein
MFPLVHPGQHHFLSLGTNAMAPASDACKPLAALRSVADALGWRGLEMWRHRLEDGTIVTWYSTTDWKFFLQINEDPPGQPDTHVAAVFADRYGICTGWHRFALGNPRVAQNLRPWLSRQLFRKRSWRRNFCRRFPNSCVERPTPKRCLKARLTGKWPPLPAGVSAGIPAMSDRM